MNIDNKIYTCNSKCNTDVISNNVPNDEFFKQQLDKMKVFNTFNIMRNEKQFKNCSDDLLIRSVIFVLFRHNMEYNKTETNDLTLFVLLGLENITIAD